MLYKLRTGDVLLAENKPENRTCAYLLSYDSTDGYSVTCLLCGGKVGSYGKNKELLEKDIKGLMNVVGVIPKETMVGCINKEFKPRLEVKCHDIVDDYELGIEIEFDFNVE